MFINKESTTTMQLKLLLLCAVVTLPSADGIPHNMVKRSDDPTPLESVVMQLSSDVSNLKAQVSALQTKLDTKDGQVAFLAQFSSAGSVITPASGPFHMDKVIFNDGNGYDPLTGIFTAPVSGVYIFAAQFFTHSGQTNRPLLDIKVNGHTYVRLAFDAASNTMTHGEDSDSTSLSVKLQAGDKVWAESTGSALDLWGIYHTFLSGALLYAD